MKPQIRTPRFFEVLEVRRLLSLNPITTTLTPREIGDSYGFDNVTFGKTGKRDALRAAEKRSRSSNTAMTRISSTRPTPRQRRSIRSPTQEAT